MYTTENDQEQMQSHWEWEDPTTEPPVSPQDDTGQSQRQPQFDVYFVQRSDEQPQPSNQITLTRSRFVLVLLVVVMVATLSGVAAAYLSTRLLAPAVTITLVPEQQTITTEQTVTVVLGSAAANQIAGRMLPTITMSQQQTVTTKIGHLPARTAAGHITFYNGLPTAQLIPAGMVLTTADGIQIVTDTDALAPAASLPMTGQIIVSAHTMQTGAASNIPAYAINGSCCRLNMFARNLAAFSGGQDAQDVPLVTQTDIDTAVQTTKAQLTQSITTALRTQLQATEALLSPFCIQSVKPDTAVGTPAAKVTVTLSETCQAVAYDTTALNQQITQAQTEQNRNQLGTDYRLSGSVQPTIRKVTAGKDKQSFRLTVQSRGVWMYQLTPVTLDHLSHLIAGTQKDAARSLLLHIPGIAQVAVNGSNMLPSDPAKIHFLIMGT